jgi:hypothetical protein
LVIRRLSKALVSDGKEIRTRKIRIKVDTNRQSATFFSEPRR